MVELAHRAARRAMVLLFMPGPSQPALLGEAVMRVHALAKAGKTNAAGEIAAAVPPPHGSEMEGGRGSAERASYASPALGGGGSHGASGRG